MAQLTIDTCRKIFKSPAIFSIYPVIEHTPVSGIDKIKFIQYINKIILKQYINTNI